MFVGHYGVSFAAKSRAPDTPLWIFFIATQFLDVMWAPFVLLGIEKVRIVPGITATNPLDLYYMPFTHSLVAALAWSVVALLLVRLHPRVSGRAALVVALAVFSHWPLDWLVHRPDLPLYDNTAKVGLGLWNLPALALALEIAFVVAGMLLFFRAIPGRRLSFVVLGVVMIALQGVVFFGAPPPSDRAAAITALAAYAIYAIAAWALERRRKPA